MDTRSLVRKAAVWIVGAVGVAPLTAEMVKRWAERNGYINDLTKGLPWLLSSVASVTEFRFYYSALSVLVGILVVLWADALMRTRSRRRALELRSLGHDMVECGHMIEHRMTRVLVEWPEGIGDHLPAVQSLLVRIHKKTGCWTPPNTIFHLDDRGHLLAFYLRTVGTMLQDGKFDRARDDADEVRLEFERLALHARR
jgi:hypothetical protein